MKNLPEGINSTFEQTEERISEFQDRSIEIIQSEEKKKKKKNKEK